jgi:replicative DNA helicase
MSAIFDSRDPGPGAQDNEVARLRVPPNSNEAEQSVLGGLLLDNLAWDRAADLLGDSDFYRIGSSTRPSARWSTPANRPT